MPKFSVKRPFTIFVAVVIVLLLGAVSFTRMKTDLLPTFSIPYIVTVATYPGASPEKVERFNGEIETFLARWREWVDRGDPYYNPNLTLDNSDFSLRR